MKLKMTKKDKFEAIEDVINQFEEYVFNLACSYKDGHVHAEDVNAAIQSDKKSVVWLLKSFIKE
jgi:hypothetical protein